MHSRQVCKRRPFSILEGIEWAGAEPRSRPAKEKGGIYMKRICCLLTAFPPAVLLSVCQPRPRRTSPGAKRAYERKLVQAQATDAPFPAALLDASVPVLLPCGVLPAFSLLFPSLPGEPPRGSYPLLPSHPGRPPSAFSLISSSSPRGTKKFLKKCKMDATFWAFRVSIEGPVTGMHDCPAASGGRPPAAAGGTAATGPARCLGGARTPAPAEGGRHSRSEVNIPPPVW